MVTDLPCLHCGKPVTGRPRKFCLACLPAFGDMTERAYMQRYMRLDAYLRTRTHGLCCGIVPTKPVPTCSVEGCERSGRLRRTYCDFHYMRWRKIGDPGKAEPRTYRRRSTAPHGSGHITPQGYRRIGSKPEHRVIMEWMLNRPLEPWESVHHLNGIRTDNRPENLELWARPQPAGQRAVDLARWVIANYPDLIAYLAAIPSVPQ